MSRVNPLLEWMHAISDDLPVEEVDDRSADRVLKAYKELVSGHSSDWNILNTTVTCDPGSYGPVTVSQIPFYSLCGHHMLPYFGDATVTYWPNRIVTGLGKIPRLVDMLARRMVIQEQLTKDIAEQFVGQIDALAVQVSTTATHMCMASRGPRSAPASTTCTFQVGDISLTRSKGPTRQFAGSR